MNSVGGEFDGQIVNENGLEHITNVSMKNFRKKHLNLKNQLEIQPKVVGYKDAFCINLDYWKIIFLYDSIT